MSSPTTEAPKPEARPKLPEGWRWVRLGELIESAQPGFASGERSPDGVIQVRMNNVTTLGTLNWIEITRVPRPSKNLEKLLLHPGDILFNNTNSVELVGKSALFQGHEEEVTFSNHFTRLRTLKHLLDPAYLTFWLVSQWQTKTFERICVRWIGQAAVQRNKLLNLELPLPPLETQRRIAAILTEQMEAVEKARKAAEEGLEAARKLTAGHLRAVFESEEAQKWPKCMLGAVTRLTAGGTPYRGNRDYYGGSIPWVKTLDLNLSWVTYTEERITETGFKAIRGELLPIGSVMIAMYGGEGTIGKSGILGIEAVTNQAICSALPNPELFIPEFLHYAVIYVRPQWMSYAGGNRRDPNINKEIIAKMQFPFPPLETQHRIVAELNAKLEATQALIRSLEAQLEAIRALPAAILRRAFSGEL